MSTFLVPFDSGKVPSAVSSIFGDPSTNDMVGSAGGGGFPVISIKGKVFHQVRGGERTLITKPGEDDPASSLEVVILRINPNNSKVFYANGFVEGESAKPTCYSNNGTKPEADAVEPQAKNCAVCAHNQWGARITADGKKGKACSDSRRMAVATLDTPNDPMLVRVPAGSLKAMVECGKILQARNTKPQQVVIKIGFDYSVAHPALTFKPVAFIGDADVAMEIKIASESDLVAQIVGVAPVPSSDSPSEDNADALPPAIQPSRPAAPKVARAAPAVSVDAIVATAAATKKVEVKVEKPAPVAQNTTALESEIGSMIDGMDFDD